MNYDFPALLVRVIDGDTVELSVDLGYHIYFAHTYRLYGVNCPEMHGPGPIKAAGLAAKDFTQQWFFGHFKFRLVSHKREGDNDKYGRYLAEIFPLDGGTSLNEDLISSGHAVSYLTR